MWAIILMGFCIGIINVSQSAPTYNVMVKKIEDGQLQLDVKEICKDAGYIRPKRDASPILSHGTLSKDDHLKKTSEDSTTPESPSTIAGTKETVTAVTGTVKESAHNVTMAEGTESDYNDTTTAANDTATETGYDVPVTEKINTATDSWHDATEMARIKGENFTAVNATVTATEPGYDVPVTEKIHTATDSWHDATEMARIKGENFTVVNATVLGVKHHITVTAETITVTESYHESTMVDVNVTATGSDRDTTETVVAIKSDDEGVVKTKNDTATGSDDDTTETLVTKSDDVIVTPRNDTVSGGDHGTTVTGETKSEHELTGKPKNDTTKTGVEDKTVTIDNSTVKSSEHYVATKSVEGEHTDSPAKQSVGASSTHGNSMSVLGILFTSLALAGIIIGISYIVYKRHKANSYILPERKLPEATPLNHVS